MVLQHCISPWQLGLALSHCGLLPLPIMKGILTCCQRLKIPRLSLLSRGITALYLTLTAGLGSIPLRSLAVSHNAGQCGVALQQIASLTMERHHGSHLVVSTHSGTVHHIPRIKTRLTQFRCRPKRTKRLEPYTKKSGFPIRRNYVKSGIRNEGLLDRTKLCY